MRPLLRAGRVLRFTLLSCVGACATGGAIRVSDVTPQSIPALEAERSQHPQDAAVLARLGVAYFKAQRFQDARSVLDSAVARDPSNGVAAVYLGMTAEQLGDFATARRAYQGYIAVAKNADLLAVARQRLALVDRRQLEYQARQALAGEATLARMPPESNTVAVMPFSYTGADTLLRPLGRGLAQLLVTDLAKSRQIRVLERERMQAILTEMKLSDSGRVDPRTAVRSGHLLRAAAVVQGSLAGLPGDRLRADAAVVDVATVGIKGTASQQDRLSQLFEMEKGLAFQIFSQLGIQLSPAEQEAVNQRPTLNIQAFLAYSRGLLAEDDGDYGRAQAAFDQAATLDPYFRAAIQGAATAGQLSAASQQTVSQVEAVLSQSEAIQAPSPAGVTDQARADALATATDQINPTSTSQTARDLLGPAPPTTIRNQTGELSGSEGPGPVVGTVVIIIRRPS
jgi:tetratricopeptide (TPR) repeat protein